MSESGPILQLTPAPAAPEPEAPAAPAASIQQAPEPKDIPGGGPMLDESQLTDAEKKAAQMRRSVSPISPSPRWTP